jgi:hypothetical protein
VRSRKWKVGSGKREGTLNVERSILNAEVKREDRV